jgi:P-type Cu+ transporter
MSTRPGWIGPPAWGTFAFLALLGLYFLALTLVSGWQFTLSQFSEFWLYVVALAAGFGLQVALFMSLKEVVSRAGSSKAMMATSGTTSTAAMISCCAHYLVNIAPVLGATGLVAFAAQYQVQFFWVGLLFNAGGVAFIGSRLFKATKEHAQCIA